MHRYNNMDHSMLTGMLAARNVMEAGHNLWHVNEEKQYHEEEGGAGSLRERLAKRIVRSTFAPIHKAAFALASGVVAAMVMFAVTAVPIATGSEELRPYLALLANYLPGYRATLSGAFLATGYAAAAGAACGWLFAWIRNAILALSLFNGGDSQGE
jgi:hypothetical protein